MPDEINTNPVSAESEEAQEDINALRQIRLDKLNELCAAGEDPFKITTADQSAHAQEIVRQFRSDGGQRGLHMRTNDVKTRYGQGELHRYP